MALAFYTQLNNNIVFNFYPFLYILLYIDFVVIVFLPSFLLKVYLIFLIKSIILAKKTRFNKKQIEINPDFTSTKYKV